MNKGITQLASIVCFLCASAVFADNDQTTSQAPAPLYQLTPLPTRISLSYENIDMPDDQENLGLTGATLAFQPHDWLYGEIGIYGATSGDLGGLFVFGAGAGVHHPIYDKTMFDAGYFLGGGGAHHNSSGENSGLMTRSHAGIEYDFGQFLLGLEYSYIHYADYDVSHGQYAFTITLPGTLLIGDPGYLGQSSDSIQSFATDQGSILGFHKAFFGATHQTYHLNNDTGTMQLIGLKAGAFVTPAVYSYLSTSGAYDNDPDGYMDAFLGLGWQHQLSEKFMAFVEGGLGTGGGGSMDTNRGFLYKPEIGIGYHLTRQINLKLSGGYIDAGHGDFNGATTNLAIDYHFLGSVAKTTTTNSDEGDLYQFDGWRIGINSETYVSPQRENNKQEQDINLVVINLEKMITRNLYIIGQAASAYDGNAGSYATGMFGLGAETQVYPKTRLGVDFLTGAAGGASMAVGSGTISQPEAIINYDLTKHFSLQAKAGKVFSYNGDLNATTWNLGVIYRFTNLQKIKNLTN